MMSDDTVECPKCRRLFGSERALNSHYGKSHGGSWKKVELTCKYCGGKYEVIPSREDRSNFCSQSCVAKWRSENMAGEKHPRWSGERNEYVCDWCNTRFKTFPHDTDRIYCSAECYRKAKSAKAKSGSMTNAVRRFLPQSWEKEREEFRSGECAMCGCDETKYDRKHDVHHIIPIACGGVNSKELLIELCRECHERAESYTMEIGGVEPVLRKPLE